jgi:hypothetical protein
VALMRAGIVAAFVACAPASGLRPQPAPPTPPVPAARPTQEPQGFVQAARVHEWWMPQFAMDDAATYVACMDGKIVRTTIIGHTPVVVARGDNVSAPPIAVESGRLFYTSAMNGISSTPAAGGTPMFLSGGIPVRAIAVRGDDLLVAHAERSLYVMSRHVPSTAVVWAATARPVDDIVIGDGEVYFTSRVAPTARHHIYRGSPPVDLGEFLGRQFAVRGGWLFAAVHTPSVVLKTPMAPSANTCEAFAADDRFAFASCGRELFGRPIDAAEWTELGALQRDVERLAVNASHVCALTEDTKDHAIVWCLSRPANLRG